MNTRAYIHILKNKKKTDPSKSFTTVNTPTNHKQTRRRRLKEKRNKSNSNSNASSSTSSTPRTSPSSQQGSETSFNSSSNGTGNSKVVSMPKRVSPTTTAATTTKTILHRMRSQALPSKFKQCTIRPPPLSRTAPLVKNEGKKESERKEEKEEDLLK